MMSKEAKMHLMEHVEWPAKGVAILKVLERLASMPKKEREMAVKMIRKARMYKNLDEVMKDMMSTKIKMHIMKEQIKEKMKMPRKMKAGTSW